MTMVDLIWTLGVGLGAAGYFVVHPDPSLRALFILIVVMLWSLRLSVHLLVDRLSHGREDPRYVNLRRCWGEKSDRNFLFLFLLQVPFVALFVFPITVAMDHSGDWAFSDTLALMIVVVALSGEFVADRQLSAFRSDPGKRSGVCQEGLWRYCRHPNYFFEWVHWWAYVAFAWGATGWWLTLAGPTVMFVFLRYLTGVPPAERSSLRNRGAAYAAYQRSTNTFFPWKPHTPPS